MGGKHLENKQYYKLVLDDYATPSFISWYKNYYGTLKEISVLIDALRRNKLLMESHRETVEAFDSFCNGNTEAEHTVAFNRCRLLTTVEMIKSKHSVLGPTVWEHINVWNCIYRMQAREIDVRRAIFRVENGYTVGIRARFRELQCNAPELDPPDRWCRLDGAFWGFPKMFYIAGDILRYRLYTSMGEYPDLSSAETAFADTDKSDFKPIVDDIFGDG